MSQDLPLDRSRAELSDYFVGDRTMPETLGRVAELVVEAVAPAAFASLTRLVDGEYRTGVATDPLGAELDQVQYDADEGPCLEACRRGEIVRVGSTDEAGAWPAFRTACRARRILSTASFPMIADGANHGALNLYSRQPEAFGGDEIRLGLAFATQAGVVLAYARSYWSARQASQHLEAALEHRAEIEQAKGIIATTGVDPDAAFEMLVAQSQHENRKLRDIAAELVQSKVRRPSGAAESV